MQIKLKPIERYFLKKVILREWSRARLERRSRRLGAVSSDPTERRKIRALLDRPLGAMGGRLGNRADFRNAYALLELDHGVTPERVASHVGLGTKKIAELVTRYSMGGLSRVGLTQAPGRLHPGFNQRRPSTIERTPGVCGGAARIAGTRIPVWLLVEAREMGVSEVIILGDYPGLEARNLVDAWEYASEHRDEILAEISRNEVA